MCIGTVSRVLNNKDRVAPRTRARIQRIVERTGYRPSAAGRALVLRRTHTIMLLLHNIADPHCTSLAKHLSRHGRTPEAIANAFLYLCSHLADEVDGHTLQVDMGVGLPKLG